MGRYWLSRLQPTLVLGMQRPLGVMSQGDIPPSPIYSHYTEEKSKTQNLGSPSMLTRMEAFWSLYSTELCHRDVHVLGLGTTAPEQLHTEGLTVRGRGEQSNPVTLEALLWLCVTSVGT